MRNIRRGEIEELMKEKEGDQRETFPYKDREIVKAKQKNRRAFDHH